VSFSGAGRNYSLLSQFSNAGWFMVGKLIVKPIITNKQINTRTCIPCKNGSHYLSLVAVETRLEAEHEMKLHFLITRICSLFTSQSKVPKK